MDKRPEGFREFEETFGDYRKRVDKLRQKMEKNETKAMMVSNPVNRTYITGFSGTNGFALITPEKSLLLTDFRYIEAATKEAPDFDIIDYGHSLENFLDGILKKSGIKSLGFESEFVSYAQYHKLSDALSGVSMIACQGMVEELRKIKENSEIEAIQYACKVSDEALAYIMDIVKPGMTEKQIAIELEYFIKKKGAEMFPKFIVASGYRAALPHGYFSDKEIKSGEFLMIDFGAQYQGYYSDITRTFVIGHADEKQKEIYDIVFHAQQNAVDTACPGISYQNQFKSATSIMEKAGYQLGHGLGHGVGLDIHELPFIKDVSEGVVEKDMVYTIEPGIYISGWGGVRIEDTVVINADGCQPLTQFSKELIIL